LDSNPDLSPFLLDLDLDLGSKDSDLDLDLKAMDLDLDLDLEALPASPFSSPLMNHHQRGRSCLQTTCTPENTTVTLRLMFQWPSF